MSGRRPALVIVVALAAMIAIDLVRGASTPGYWAGFGLIGCVALIVVPKWLGTRWLWRPAPRDGAGAPGSEDL